MPAAVRPTLIFTTDLERELHGKLRVAERYGRDRDREIAALERQLRVRDKLERGFLIGHAAADSTPNRDGTHSVVVNFSPTNRPPPPSAPDPDPVLYRITRSDLDEPLPWLLDELTDAWCRHRGHVPDPEARRVLANAIAALAP